MKKLWQKKSGKKLHPLIEAYTVGEDCLLDVQLLPYDLKASLAHAKMLHKIDQLLRPPLGKGIAF